MADVQAADTGLPRARQDGEDGEDGPGAAAAAAGGAPRAAGAQHAAGPGGDAALAAGRPGNGRHRFALRVPFPTPLEADIARGSLAPDAEPRRGALRKELSVSGSVLAVRWGAEDARLLRTAVTSFLDQLSLVVRTMRRFGPPLSR